MIRIKLIYIIMMILLTNKLIICQNKIDYSNLSKDEYLNGKYRNEIKNELKSLDTKSDYLIREVIDYFPTVGYGYDSTISLINQIRQNYMKEEDTWNLQYYRDEVRFVNICIERYKFFKRILKFKIYRISSEELINNESKYYIKSRDGIISRDTLDFEIYFAYLSFTLDVIGSKDYDKFINRIKNDKFMVICVKSTMFRNQSDINVDSILAYASFLSTLDDDDLKKVFYFPKSGRSQYYGWLKKQYQNYEQYLIPEDTEKAREHIERLIKYRKIKKEEDIDSIKQEYEKIFCNEVIVKTCKIYKKYGNQERGYVIGVDGILNLPCNRGKEE